MRHYFKFGPEGSPLAYVKFTYGQFRYFWGEKFALKFHILSCLTCEELVRFFSDVKNLYQIFTNVKNRYQILPSVTNWYQIITCVKLVSKLTHVKNWYKILTHKKNWYQIITDVKIWYLIVTDVSDKTVKNWNRMQNAADLVYYQCEGYACLLNEI